MPEKRHGLMSDTVPTVTSEDMQKTTKMHVRQLLPDRDSKQILFLRQKRIMIVSMLDTPIFTGG